MHMDVMFLGAFAELRKATFSFVVSISPSARNNLSPTERIFMKFDTLAFFENLFKKIHVSFRTDKNNEYFA
jgi:hypothetical protein